MAKIECKGCTPNCPYFPYMDGTVDWEYNEEGLKVRKKKKIFVCYFAFDRLFLFAHPQYPHSHKHR